MSRRLGVGFVGSGFITRFHIESWVAVRDSDVRGVWSPNATRAEEAAALAREKGVGDAKAFTSIESMVKDPGIDAIWICGPNHERIPNMEAIVAALEDGGALVGIASEKPLARKPRESLTPKRVTAQIACLKWQRPPYIETLKKTYGSDVDYRKKPSEDFARALVEYEDESGEPLIVEATTSWSYVGAGLRLSMELLGPEYSMKVDTLDTELSLFFSRELQKAPGPGDEYLVEKQNAELGLMPVGTDEGAVYGYVSENRHMVQAFVKGERPEESFDDGVAVTALLMAAYQGAELGETVELDEAELRGFIPAVARGTWNPRRTHR